MAYISMRMSIWKRDEPLAPFWVPSGLGYIPSIGGSHVT